MNNAPQRVFLRGLTDGSHTLRFDVERTPNEGWRIREQRDAEVVRQVVYGDWHRVELAIDALMSRASRTIDVPGGELEDVFLWQLN